MSTATLATPESEILKDLGYKTFSAGQYRFERAA